METFPALLAICAGNSPVTNEFPAQRPVTWSFDVFFDLYGWVNSVEAGDLRRPSAHYDVTVMQNLISHCETVRWQIYIHNSPNTMGSNQENAFLFFMMLFSVLGVII